MQTSCNHIEAIPFLKIEDFLFFFIFKWIGDYLKYGLNSKSLADTFKEKGLWWLTSWASLKAQPNSSPSLLRDHTFTPVLITCMQSQVKCYKWNNNLKIKGLESRQVPAGPSAN